MADKEEDLDLDVKGGGKSNTVLLIVLIVLLLLVGGGGAAFFLLHGGDDSAKSDTGVTAKQNADKVEVKEAHYLELGKEFVVNLEDTSKVNYLQVSIQVMARKTKPLDLIKENMPMIRNKLMLILSSQKYEKLNTRKGKEALRKEIKQAIQEILHEESPKANIDAVYFTSLIMQ